MARKIKLIKNTKKKQLTDEEIMDRWVSKSSQDKLKLSVTEIEKFGWSPGGDFDRVVVDDVNYDKFYISDNSSEFVVVEWDDSGNIAIL